MLHVHIKIAQWEVSRRQFYEYACVIFGAFSCDSLCDVDKDQWDRSDCREMRVHCTVLL